MITGPFSLLEMDTMVTLFLNGVLKYFFYLKACVQVGI